MWTLKTLFAHDWGSLITWATETGVIVDNLFTSNRDKLRPCLNPNRICFDIDPLNKL